MASINGLSVKKVRSFIGPEGHVYQGDLYLGKKKIAFWSQDANGAVEDHLVMESDYSEAKLRKAIIAANPDKTQFLRSHDGHSFTIEYDIEELMYDLLLLRDAEKDRKKALNAKAGFSGVLIITDGYYRTVWALPDSWKDKANTVDEALKLINQKTLTKTYEKMRKGHDVEKQLFWSDSDFSIGNPIPLENILK